MADKYLNIIPSGWKNALKSEVSNLDDIYYEMGSGVYDGEGTYYDGKKEFDTSTGLKIYRPADLTTKVLITGDFTDMGYGTCLIDGKASANAIFTSLAVSAQMLVRDFKDAYPTWIEDGSTDSGPQEGANCKTKNGGTLVGNNNSFVNCLFFDNVVGISAGQDGGPFFYGNICYNNGFYSYNLWAGDTERRYKSSGPNMYMQHYLAPTGVIQKIEMGINCNSLRKSAQYYGSKAINNMHISDETFFHAGQISHEKETDGAQIVFGSLSRDDNMILSNSVSYASANHKNFAFGWSTQSGYAKADNNYIWGGGYDIIAIDKWENFEFINHTIVCNQYSKNIKIVMPDNSGPFSSFTYNNNIYYTQGFALTFSIIYAGTFDGQPAPAHQYDLTWAEFKTITGWDSTSTWNTGTPPDKVFVKKNTWGQKMGKIEVCNHTRQETVSVDLSTILAIGDTYEIRDVQNIGNYLNGEGDYIIKTTYDGALVTLPMNLTEVTQPTGSGLGISYHTDKEFNCFVVWPQNYLAMPHHNGTSVPTTTTTLANPSDCRASLIDATTVGITFTDNSADELGFEIERSTDNITFALVQTQVGTSWNDTGKTENVTYYYRVRAYKTGEVSGYSNTAQITTTIIKTSYRAPFPNSTAGNIRIGTGGYNWKILKNDTATQDENNTNNGISNLTAPGNRTPINSAKSEISETGFLYYERSADQCMIYTEEIQTDMAERSIEDFRWLENSEAIVDSSLILKIGTQWYNCAEKHTTIGLVSRADFYSSAKEQIQIFKPTESIWRKFTANPGVELTPKGTNTNEIDHGAAETLPVGIITGRGVYFHGNTHVRLTGFETNEVDIITVGDTVPPEITLTGGDLLLTEGDAYLEPGVSALDDVDGVVTVQVDYGTLNTTTANLGTHTISYNATDAALNAATTKTRIVTVESAPEPDPYIASISEINLRYVSDGRLVRNVQDGDIITISERVYIEVVTDPYPVGSLKFDLNGGAGIWNENNHPYTMYAKSIDETWEATGSISMYGTLSLEVTPYEFTGQTGRTGTVKHISFTLEPFEEETEEDSLSIPSHIHVKKNGSITVSAKALVSGLSVSETNFTFEYIDCPQFENADRLNINDVENTFDLYLKPPVGYAGVAELLITVTDIASGFILLQQTVFVVVKPTFEHPGRSRHNILM